MEASWVYASSGGNLTDLRHLEELGLVALSESEVWRDPLAQVETPLQNPPQLTDGQAEVWQQLQSGLRQPANWNLETIHPARRHGLGKNRNLFAGSAGNAGAG